MFADFDVDPDGRVYAVRVSFDGYGCCDAAGVGRMSARDSELFLTMWEQGSFDGSAAPILRTYFQQNRDVLWGDALEEHGLL